MNRGMFTARSSGHARHRVAVRAEAEGSTSQRPELPKRKRNGYFDEVDIHAPLHKPIVGQQNSDPLVRSKDRYTSDFIWNTKWQDRLNYQDAQARKAKEGPVEEDKNDEGFLSFSRVADLNDMNTDLSEQLRRKPKKKTYSAAATIQMNPAPKRSSKAYNDPPTPGEAKRWERSSGYVRRGSSSSQVYSDEGEAQIAEARAIENAKYERLKQEYSLWTTGTVAVCFAGVYALYTRDVAASYLIGALGGIMYLRLLNRSIDGVGASSMEAAAGSALAQPRLLIPVILVLVYNRFNLLYSEQVGLHLELLPMLAGFFTYKAGVLGRGSLTLFRQLSGKPDDLETQLEKRFDEKMVTK